MPLDWGLTLYSTMKRNANPFQTYLEMGLRCFWENNVDTLNSATL